MLRAALAAILVTATPALAEIAVRDPYAITPVPGAPTGAAYMLIHNDGPEADRLLGARAPAARAAELHQHLEEDGIMRMRPVEGGLELPAGGDLVLGRGEAHVMLMGLEEPLVDGTTFPLTLIFEDAGEIEVEIPVDLARLIERAGAHGDGDASEHGGEAGHEGH